MLAAFVYIESVHTLHCKDLILLPLQPGDSILSPCFVNSLNDCKDSSFDRVLMKKSASRAGAYNGDDMISLQELPSLRVLAPLGQSIPVVPAPMTIFLNNLPVEATPIFSYFKKVVFVHYYVLSMCLLLLSVT